MRITYGQLKDALARAADGGIAVTDARLLSRTNEAVQRLLAKGDWVGTVARYSFYVTGKVVTMPSEIEAINAYAIDNRPGDIRGYWYEFQDNGPGVLNDTSCAHKQCVDRGTVPTMSDLVGTKYLKVYTTQTEDVPAPMLLVKGWDENNDYIRTTYNGSLIDGEMIPLSATPQYSQHQYQKIESLTKPVTNGDIRLFSCTGNTDPDPVELTRIYWWEQSPNYRQYYLSDIGDTARIVTIIAKRGFVPVRSDNDDVIIPNLGALQYMLRAIWAEDVEDFVKAAQLEQRAVDILNEQKRAYHGTGNKATLNIQTRGFSGGAIRRML